MPCIGYPCNNSLLECFIKGVLSFEKIFQGFFLKVCFESICEVWFEIRQVFSLQIDKYLRVVYPKIFSKIFVMF